MSEEQKKEEIIWEKKNNKDKLNTIRNYIASNSTSQGSLHALELLCLLYGDEWITWLISRVKE